MRRPSGIKIPQQDFVLKMQGGLMCEGGGVFAGHYGTLRYWYYRKQEVVVPVSKMSYKPLCLQYKLLCMYNNNKD